MKKDMESINYLITQTSTFFLRPEVTFDKPEELNTSLYQEKVYEKPYVFGTSVNKAVMLDRM